MISLNDVAFPIILNNHISVQMAALYSGYCAQYLRRLLRNGKLDGIKIGQQWLIDKAALDKYLNSATQTTDNRFGPQSSAFFSISK